ncbi:hypothetical protein LINPERPRIM_LOCUS30576, partial [Linum perenne]
FFKICWDVIKNEQNRGFRQGDPIFPYLFIISMEVLAGLLAKACREGSFLFHPQCRGVSLTHLCFADGLIVFTKGSAAGGAGGPECPRA